MLEWKGEAVLAVSFDSGVYPLFWIDYVVAMGLGTGAASVLDWRISWHALCVCGQIGIRICD